MEETHTHVVNATTEEEVPKAEESHQQGEKSQMIFSLEGVPNVISKRITGLVEVLNREVVDLGQLKTYLALGIPDEAAHIREFCWKIILGYLPQDKSKWEETVQKQTQTYETLVKMFLPQDKFPDYPLWLKKGHPRFQELESDYLLWEQIEKDTSRTHAEFTFFATASSEIMLPYLTSARREKFKLINGEDELPYKQFLNDKEKQRKTYRYDYMTRILYIYAKLNPKILYVQGMNQILAPIFYLVNITKPAELIEQASCFFMFNNAISDIIELHIKDFDKSKNGIHGKLTEVNQMLMVIDPEVWKRLEELKIDPFYYCFRWVTLLYAQDFPLFDTLRIWESIFSSENRMQYINFFAIGIIVSCRQFIIQNEFTVVLEHLQDIREHIVIREVIKITNELIKRYSEYNFSELFEKGKKKVQKQMQREKQKKQRESAKDDDRSRRKREKQREKHEGVQEDGQEEEKGSFDERGEGVKEMGAKVQKKLGGFFKKMGNMVDKFMN